MHTFKRHNLFGIFIAIICLSAFPHQSQAASKNNHKIDGTTKERLVLMPLRVPDEDKNLTGAMETALVKGLQQKYDVFSGELVSQKAHEIFMKETRNIAHKECDETKCMQNIAMAFQAELIATANVTKQDGIYFLALSVQNIFDNKIVYSESLPCENCNGAKVIEKLKELSGIPTAMMNQSTFVSTQQNSAEFPVMVRIPGKNYEMGKYDVTRGEFAKFVSETGYDAGNSCFVWTGGKWGDQSGSNWRNSGFAQDDTHPVTCVNWNDAQAYAEWLSRKTGKQYRIPTEKEWEYACYGGSKTAYCGGNNPDSVAWYDKNSNSATHPVGQKQANGYGLYDMSGNVLQWMQNKYDSEHDWRRLRGGSWFNDTDGLRAAYRDAYALVPATRGSYIGFRVARTLP